MKEIPMIVLSLLCALPALAESNQTTAVPAEARWIYGYTQVGYDGSGAVNTLLGAVQQKDAEMDVEYNCQKIFYNWGHESTWKKVTVSVHTYCVERSYEQKIVLSLVRRCEANPTAECFDEKVKSTIKTLQPVARYETGRADAEDARQQVPPGGVLIPAPMVIGYER